MKVKGVRLYAKDDIRLEEFELPEIKDDEILVKVMSDSICMSTWKMVKQGANHKRVPADVAEHPVIIGHEFAGDIVKVGKKWQDKFKPGQKPMLRFDILDEITKRLPQFPIVLHGASSVSQNYVKIIQENGGNLADAIGIPEDMLRQAARSAVCKINIDSDLRLAMTAGIREVLYNHPEVFDPREYLKVGRAYVKEVVEHKITEVLGCAGKAAEIKG